MSKGRITEQIISIIEDTLQGNENVKITHDTTLTDEYGNDRQIDVLIEYKVNDRTTFNSIIECKYKGRDGVEVNQMQAFKGLLDSLKDVHQGIFVSTNGFQKGAIKVANANNIKLYTLEELSPAEIENWVKISPTYNQLIKHFEVHNYQILNSDGKAIQTSEDNILRNEKDEKFTVEKTINLLSNYRANQLHNILFDQQFKGREIDKLKIRNKWILPLNNGFFLEKDGEKIEVSVIQLDLSAWFSQGIEKTANYRLYKDSGKNPIAGLIEADVEYDGSDIKLGLVKDFEMDKEGFYFYDGKNNRVKLEIEQSMENPQKNTKVFVMKKPNIEKQ